MIRYDILVMVFLYFIPLVIMGLLYARIGNELWRSAPLGEPTPTMMEQIKAKKRVVKMMVMVVLIFAVCWLPYHAYFIVSNVYPVINHNKYIQVSSEGH